MLSSAGIWTSLGLLILGMKGLYVEAHNDQYHASSPPSIVTSKTTKYYQSLVTDVDTVSSTVPTTTTVPTTAYTTSTIILFTTETCTVPVTTTLPTTVTVHITATVITTLTATATDTTTIPTTTTITTTVPTTIVVPTTITLFPTFTSTSTSTFYDPCPSSCSISAGTVDVFYWPTRYPNVTYPATYVDTALDYTFTSPSVYMLINTMYGTNSLGKVGPDARSTIVRLNLDEVSTLVLPAQTETRQLTLNDLGTDCPRSLDPSVIATKTPDSSCDPVLAAPWKVKSWAFPCNACGPFGLFDPPYAVPTLPGGLLGPTTVAVSATTPAPAAPPPASSAPPAPAPTSAAAPAPAPPPPPPPPPAASSASSAAPVSPVPPPVQPTTSAKPVPTIIPPSSTTSVVPVATALASRITDGTGFMILGLSISMFLLF